MAKVLRGRTENSIKNYFYSSLRRIKQSPVYEELKEIYLTKNKTQLSWESFYELHIDEYQKFNYLSKKLIKTIVTNYEGGSFQAFLLSLLLD